MVKFTYEYYDPTGKIVNKKKPWMHIRLEAVLENALAPLNVNSCHIVHIGTTASASHYRQNPRSKHSGVPPTPPPQKYAPEAIDVVKIWLKRNGQLVYHFDLREDLKGRKVVSDWIKKYGNGSTAHANNAGKGHLHIQTK